MTWISKTLLVNTVWPSSKGERKKPHWNRINAGTDSLWLAKLKCNRFFSFLTKCFEFFFHFFLLHFIQLAKFLKASEIRFVQSLQSYFLFKIVTDIVLLKFFFFLSIFSFLLLCMHLLHECIECIKRSSRMNSISFAVYNCALKKENYKSFAQIPYFCISKCRHFQCIHFLMNTAQIFYTFGNFIWLFIWLVTVLATNWPLQMK